MHYTQNKICSIQDRSTWDANKHEHWVKGILNIIFKDIFLSVHVHNSYWKKKNLENRNMMAFVLGRKFLFDEDKLGLDINK